MYKIIGLNTLRFFAFLSIFLFHATPHFRFGYFGVDFFFVLSSFLLTYLAYVEIETKGYFSKWNFLGRRVLRIFPLYYLIILVSFIFIPIINSSTNLPSNKLIYLLFLSNYETSDCIYSLKFLWSISVEEQFYLLFIVLSFLLNRKVLLFVVILMLSYFIFMFYSAKYNISTYSNTITHFPNFSAGIIGGYLYFNKIKNNNQYLPLLLCIVSLVGIIIIQNEILTHLNISIFFLSLIFIFIQHSGYLSNFYLFKLTEKLGDYSYGLYVYSGFILTIVPKLFIISNPYYDFMVKLILVILTAFISYHLYEKHFLKLKKYFS